MLPNVLQKIVDTHRSLVETTKNPTMSVHYPAEPI
jgi:hypothetical protein